MCRTTVTFLVSGLLLLACGDEGDGPLATDGTLERQRAVLAAYAAAVHSNYSAALASAEQLEDAVAAFIAAPSAATHDAAKAAWLDARHPYGQSEAFRFAGGPIDDDDGPEGRINAWPLDESYIDYVEGSTTAGIVNDPQIELTKARLSSLNEGGEGDVFGVGDDFDEEAAVATGYHAIEFLLWGQDRRADGAGARPWQDYLTDDNAAHPNGARRAEYLRVVTELLVDDLSAVTAEWAPAVKDNYRARLLAPGDEDRKIKNLFASIGILAKGELAGERIDVALANKDQEDEHSCFSDNTHVDIRMNLRGIQNVYLGRFGAMDGAGLDELVRAADPALDRKISDLLRQTLIDIEAMPLPFDQAIIDAVPNGRSKLTAIIDQLFDLGDAIAAVGPALGYGAISVELPE